MVMDVPAPHGEAIGVDVPDETGQAAGRGHDRTRARRRGPVGAASSPSISMCPQTRSRIYPRALFLEVPRRVAGAPGSRSQAPGPSVQVLAPSIHVLAPSAQVLDPSVQVLDPSAQVLDPSVQVLGPSAQVLGPS